MHVLVSDGALSDGHLLLLGEFIMSSDVLVIRVVPVVALQLLVAHGDHRTRARRVTLSLALVTNKHDVRLVGAAVGPLLVVLLAPTNVPGAAASLVAHSSN